MADDTSSAKRKSYTSKEKLDLVLAFRKKRAQGEKACNFAKNNGIQASWLNRLDKEYLANRHRAFERDQSGLIVSLKKQNNRLRTEVRARALYLEYFFSYPTICSSENSLSFDATFHLTLFE